VSDIKTLITEVKAHDARATPGPWHPQRGAIRVDLPGPIEYTWAIAAYPKDVVLIAHYRTAAPILAAEVERLNLEHAARGAEVRRLTDDLKHVSTALGERLCPNQTPASAITRLIGDLEACEKERNAYQSSAELAADRANRAQAERDELRLALLAEQGDIKGVPDGWKRTGSMWFRPLGPVNHQVEVRRSTIHPTGEPYHWTLYTPTLTAEGYAPTAREAMKRADKAWQEKR